ncbi:protein ELYS [Microplitis demolitor]|uniref:protein ELYS n=1 Tax=Microplitis demolitor TaxID=69319 RepID=UPI0004CD4BD1|nr:protein ELYS [Microplitis demolitor]
MEELEDTCCEIRKKVQLPCLNLHYSNTQDVDSNSIEARRVNNYFPSILGGFFDDVDYGWLSCGSKLIVFNVKTGINISYKFFKGQISCVSPFPSQPNQPPLLLVGLDNGATRMKESLGMVCIFDCMSSQILRSIKMPASVEKLCVINGGAEWEKTNESRIDNRLLKSHGVACVALKNLDCFMIDLRRNRWESNNLFVADEVNPAEIDIIPEKRSKYKYKAEEHFVLNLMNEHIKQEIGQRNEELESLVLSQKLYTSIIKYSKKIGCVIAGCLGRVIIWQADGYKWISPSVGDNMIVTHIALLEPADDPRPFCYLWVSYQNKLLNSPPILKMYAMLFEKKCLIDNTCVYFNLEAEPSLKFELKLQENDKVINLISILRESNSEQSESIEKRGESSLLLISVEGKIILFDLNQWYKEQMPRFVSECHNINSILACYQTKSKVSVSENLIDCAYIPSTLKEFFWTNLTSPEEFYYPNALSLEWIELTSRHLTVWMTRGLQAQLLREIVTSGSITLSQPSKIFHRCITAGLIPYNSDASLLNDVDSQRDSLLTLCLERRLSIFLLKCAKEWSDGGNTYLYSAFLRWSIQRASVIKLSAHQLCTCLFDQSGHSIDEAEIKTLRFLSQQMECLCNVVENLPITEDLEQQRQAFYRISMYLEILLWFCDVGLLPEMQDINEEAIHISFNPRIPYPATKLSVIYTEKRKQYQRTSGKNGCNEETLFIDELITRECPALRFQWELESNKTDNKDKYPPPSLQSLIRSCLIDCHRSDSNEIEIKHQIIIYLLMDLVMELQNAYSGVGQLIKYPSAFKLSPSLIKLTHAMWFLDHEDYQGFLDIMIGQLVLDSDIKNWHHEFILRTLVQNNQNKLASIYIKIRKPPLSSIDDQSTLVTLSIEHGLVQSAFHKKSLYHNGLLIKFFRACQLHGKLNDILHLILDTEEEKAFMQFLEQQKYGGTQLLYYLQRCRYIEANNVLLSDQNLTSLKKKKKIPVFFSMFQALNTTLPQITQRFTTNSIKWSKLNNFKSHPRPMSYVKDCVSAHEICEIAIKNAKDTFYCKNIPQIPFLSAPCLFLKTTEKTSNSNYIRFPISARSYSEKRTLDQTMINEELQNDGENLRKRCKITKTNDKIDDSTTKDISLITIWDTPLIKRKNQISHTADTQCETPQSILKIRQMIQNSSSPSGIISSVKKNIISDREKKPRQIRFSVYQSMTNESTDEIINNSKKSIENQRDILDDDIMIKDDNNIVPEDDISEESEEAYSSLNTSTKSLYESTILTNASLHDFKNISGPCTRPHLRRKDFSESCHNSLEISVDLSPKPNIISSTFIHGTEKTPNSRLSLPSTSIYASTLLSSDSSFELSRFNTPIKYTDPLKTITRPTADSSKLFLKHNLSMNKDFNDENNMIDSFVFSENDNTKKCITKEVCMNDIDKNNVSLTISEEFQNFTDYKREVKKLKQFETTNNTFEINVNSNNKFSEENTYIKDSKDHIKSSNNYNDELVLRYEEDASDDGLISTFNSREINDIEKISVNCCEDLNITDDESSKGSDNNIMNTERMNIKKIEDIKNSPELSATILVEDIDITDDETDENFKSIELSEDIDMSQHKQSKVTNENKQSSNFEKFNTSQIKENESFKLDVIQNKCETSNESNKNINQSSTENEGPAFYSRTTRSRRASSVIPVIEEPNVEIQKNIENIKAQYADHLTKQELSLVKETPILSSQCLMSEDLSSIKKKSGRRSISLSKELLVNKVDDGNLSNNNRKSSLRRNTRNSRSEQKELIALEEKSITDVKPTITTSITARGSSEEPDSNKKNTKSTRVGSVSKNMEVKKNRLTVVTETCDEDSSLQNTKTRRTRKTSTSSNTTQNMVDEKPVSVQKMKNDPGSKTSSSTLKKVGQSKSSETTEFIKTSEINQSDYVPLAKRTRSASISKENPEESLTKKKRSELSTRKTAEDSSVVTKKLKSVSEEKTKSTNVSEDNKYVTRRKGSISKEIIDKSIKTKNENNITPIPEEQEMMDEIKELKKVTRGRQRRAMSVDLMPTASKQQTRQLLKNSTLEHLDEEKELFDSQLDICTEDITTTKNLRRSKRAKSETKDFKNITAFENPKRNSKTSHQKEKCNDENLCT